MASWCLTKQAALNFKQALKSGEINPEAMAKMDSTKRREFVAKYVGKENAKQVNSLFESKILLKNQKAGYIAWAKKVSGITPQVKRDLLARIERLDRVLSPKEEQLFLKDLASTRLGIDVTQAEAQSLNDLSNIIVNLRQTADAEGKFTSRDDAFRYGMAKVAIEKYVNDLKLQSRRISFKTDPGKKIVELVKESPGAMKSIVASLDNSFWGRQGIKTLLDIRTSPIWVKNFLRSWVDIGKELAGFDAMDAIRADIYSRENSINGKYEAGGYGLDVLTEEAFPSSLPEKIPGLRRLFKASEVAFNGGALRMRADLADRLITIAERQGVNTLNSEQARGLGSLVNSLTGRGNLGKGEVLAKDINVLLFSVKFMKSNFDTLTAHSFDPRVKANPVARKEAAKSLLSIVASLAGVMTLAKTLNPDSVDEDPRSTNFGKVKIFGHWRDISGGMAPMVTLAARITPTWHDGKLSFWKRTANGDWIDLAERSESTGQKKFGAQTPVDLIVEGLFLNKLSPIAGLFRDAWKQEFFGGEPFTVEGAAKRSLLPLSIQNFEDFVKDPASTFVLGDMILEGLGLGTSGSIAPNKKTKAIPTNKRVSEENFLNTVAIYSSAIGTDPETAFNRIFTGQKIVQVSDGGIIVVDRQDVADSEAYKRKFGKDTKQVRLDHTIPNKLGGEERPSNWKVVSKSLHASYTPVETALIKAVKNKKIKLKDAQKEIVKFKSIEDSKQRKEYGLYLRSKYK